MARILVQTDDRRTVLDERNVGLTDVADVHGATGLLDRLQAAIEHAERMRPKGARRPRRGSVVSVAHYRDIGA